ncbi:phosphoenolpyruvate--protein phosphotransferase [Lipingzhangella sp. LS1_29]|uniref:Phosphoenolpyruvate-protein phosphotransferase n=1 Tax=Lipingzhangella rawalii TaxID=2055835 RepID=A0ABU2H1W6_9ACTN|nr:phosphoenolpyruvate--protein phosphotransferase [Lipingzhangella rawalii]MDS1268997.1 phosphoenolpyruvate--protein phosphotransferase [Lipingzhangella rawalii]
MTPVPTGHHPGRPAGPGIALGPAFVITTAAAAPDEEETAAPAEPDHEHRRVDHALRAAATALRTLAAEVSAATDTTHAEIFHAQAQMATDAALAERIHAAIEEGSRAPAAVRDAFSEFRSTLAASTNPSLAERVADLDDVRGQVLAVLAGRQPGRPVPTAACIVVADELTPAHTVRLPRAYVRGIVCASGTSTSHAAILARALGIPAVMGVTGITDLVREGVPVLVNGDDGTVTLNPDEETRAQVQQELTAQAETTLRLRAAAHRPGHTRDGRRVEVAANIDTPDAARNAVSCGAEGAGLVRTELLFLRARQPPSVAEQAEYYRWVAQQLPGARVVFRTMDIGADKPLPFAERGTEANPALGLRGLRLGLGQPQLLRDQLRAVLRAARSCTDPSQRLAVMFPMVTTCAEIRRAQEILAEAAEAERAGIADIDVGIMVEVPAAALATDRLAPLVDFVSLGTNDLVQYLFAADRTNAAVAGIPELCTPEVLQLVRGVVAAGHRSGARVAVCGETAADPLTAAALVGAGVDELSAAPPAIPQIKAVLARLDAVRLTEIVAEASTLDSAEAVRDRLTAELAGAVGDPGTTQ